MVNSSALCNVMLQTGHCVTCPRKKKAVEDKPLSRYLKVLRCPLTEAYECYPLTGTSRLRVGAVDAAVSSIDHPRSGL